ncbi:hypothetical protein AB0K40_07850 [Nonomuraea bangladeshensis]|uniref:Uncharacterized protein n=1 Tax=Nonomuraea bangladeshensis TaxID=404385 RepID=A0ABV3GYP5_9ACTN
MPESAPSWAPIFFHLYGTIRKDVDYILETFQPEIGDLKNNEIAKYDTYHTKDLVLPESNRMAARGLKLEIPLVDGGNYTSTLNLRPAWSPPPR